MARPGEFPPKLALVLAAILPGCGGGGGDDGGGVTPPPSTTISKNISANGDQQSSTAGQALPAPIRVLVTQDGAPAAGVTVTWSTNSAGASLAATSSTGADGIASNTWTLGTAAGQQTAAASLTGASGSPVVFTATAVPDAPATLSEFGGNRQSGDINTQLGAPVQAKVSDQFGNGVPGVAVNWAATNATLSASTVPTDPSGISGVTVTLGGSAGPVTITATSGTLAGSPVSFTATASEPGTVEPVVTITNDRFIPGSLTVPAGTTVVWTWAPNAFQHNVVPDGTLPPRSGNPQNGPATYQFRFDTPGTYQYYCQVHGGPNGFAMSGVIIVQ